MKAQLITLSTEEHPGQSTAWPAPAAGQPKKGGRLPVRLFLSQSNTQLPTASTG